MSWLSDFWARLFGKKKSKRIADIKGRYDRGELEGALAEAEVRVQRRHPGWRYAGNGITIVVRQGQLLPGSGGMYGDPATNTAAAITGGTGKQIIYLYVDNHGRERWEELVHEMGHAVLFSHAVRGHPAEYRGIFENWRD